MSKLYPSVVPLRTSLHLLTIWLLLALSAQAQDFPHDNRSARLRGINEFEPPVSDELFVGTEGANYDNYLFRKDLPNGRLTLTVDVTRYYSNQMKFDAKGFLTNARDLIETGLLPPSARVTMRVYDVDHNSQYDGNRDGVADPEVDYVYINGNLIRSESGQPRTLGSGNNTWSTPSFVVPIEYIKFPQKAGSPKATNEIQIDVDVPNTTYWAVECDWVSIQIESKIRPVVLVRGYAASNFGNNAESTWRTFMNFLQSDGIPFHLATSIDGCAHIFDNVPHLAAEIALAKKQFGVQKVNILAHSKGGLDTRAYLRSNTDVENVIQLGTPNHGSGFADIGEFVCDADDDLDPDWLANNFNYANKNKDIKLYEAERSTGIPIYLLIGTDGWISPGDKAVAANRATLPWYALYKRTYVFGTIETEDLTDPTNVVNDGAYPLNHTELHERAEVYQHSIRLINSKVVTRSNRFKRVAAPVEVTETAQPVANPDTLATVLIQRDQVAAGTAKSYRFYVPLAGPAYAQGLVQDSKATFRLESPTGRVIPSSGTGFTREEIPSGYLHTYRLDNAESGYWTLTVQGSGSATPVYAKAYARSTKRAAIGTEKYNYGPKEAIAINARFTMNATPVTQGRGVVYVYKESVRDSIQLFDDGAHSDVKANDGIYGNTLPGFAETGRVYLVAKLQKDAESLYDEASVAVVASSAEFTNAYRESAFDRDGDNLFDTLQVRVGFRVKTAGHYMISGALRDAQGKLITTASWTNSRRSTLPVDTYEAVLNFDGRRISANGVSGPYTLDDLVLTDVSESAIVDTRKKAFTTRSYNALFFSQPPIVLTGQNSETPVDTDKDSDYDYLDIKLQVKASLAGSYDVSAELVDSLQNSLNWTEKSVYLSVGTNELVLRFSGEEINEKLANGRFILTNLYFNSSVVSVTFYDVYRTKAYRFSQFSGNILTGTVSDQLTKAPVANATVILKGAKLATVQTNAQGQFTLAGLPTGAYTVEARKDNYCSSTVTTIAQLTSNLTVSLTIINQKLTISDKKTYQICPGDSLKLTLPAGWRTYRWSNGISSLSVVATSSGLYSATATLPGCQALSDTVSVTVINVGKPTITTDGAATLMASAADGYQWYKDGQLIAGATSQTYKASLSGRYTVRINAKGCSAVSDPFNLIITATDPASLLPVRLYPNPNKGVFWVELSQIKTPWTITIYDAQGRQLLHRIHAEKLTDYEKVDVRFSPGIYMLRVTNGDRSQISRFLIE